MIVAALHRGTTTGANSGAMKALVEDVVVINPAVKDSADRDPPAASGDLHHVSISRKEKIRLQLRFLFQLSRS